MPPDEEKTFNPYIGPQPFESKDKELFFGRSQETEEIVSLIFGHPVVLVYAESGAGKTSLFNAQVIPTLEQDGFQVLPVTRVKGKPPEAANLKDITNLYMFNVLRSMSPESNQKDLSSQSLSSFLDRYPHKVNKRQKPALRILVIDQFEELFTIYVNGWREQQNAFFKQISEAVTADPMLRIVLIIREDYLAQLDPFSKYLPERLRARFRLVRLNREAARSAVTGPLKNTKRSYSKGVAEGLVEELLKVQVEIDPRRSDKVTGEYVEPVQLQVVCERLWEKLPPEITEITKKYVGDVDNALADFYVKAIYEAAAKTGIEESVIRDWCETKLITSSGTRSIIHREAETTSGIPNRVVDILENKRLIKTEQRFGALWYELTHDRLISPIKDSNKMWKYEREREKYEREREKYEREKKKKSIIIKSIVPSIAVIIIGILVALTYSGFIDVKSSPEVIYINVGQTPFIPSVNPNTNMLYIPDTTSNKVFVMDGITNHIISNLTVGNKPTSIAVNPNTNMVYIANYGDNTVSVIDGNNEKKNIFANAQYFIGALIYGSNYNKNNLVTNTVLTNISVGKNPTSLSVNPKTNLIYVANYGDNTVSIIDGRTNKITHNVLVGQNPSAISVNSKTNLVYVANSGDNTVSVIDSKTNKLLPRHIVVGQNPSAISVNPKTNLIYVANPVNNAISVINGTTNNVVKTIHVGNGPSGIFANPKTNLIYVANQGSNTIAIMNGTTNNVLKTLVIGNGPEGLAINPNTNMIYASDKYDNSVIAMNALTMGTDHVTEVDNSPNAIYINTVTNQLYVSNNDSKTISVIDVKTNKVINKINTDSGQNYLSINPKTNLIYVANYGDNTVSVIDGRTNKLLPRQIAISNGSYYLSINPKTNLIYVANYGDNTVSVIDGRTNKITHNVLVGQNPSAISVNPKTNLIYVANSGDNTVSVIDSKTNKVIDTITVGSRPICISLNPNTNMVYVSNSDSKTISVINGTTKHVARTLHVGNGPSGIAVNSKTNLVYVANSGDDTISVINGKTTNVVKTLKVDNGPSGIAVDPSTNIIYVDDSLSNKISIINGTTTELESIQLG